MLKSLKLKNWDLLSNFLIGYLLVVATYSQTIAKNFLYADPVLFFIASLLLINFIKTANKKFVNYLFLLLFPLAFSMFWTLDVSLTMFSTIRILALAIIANYILRNFNERMFYLGIFLGLSLQALPLILVIGQRHNGLARYESLLGAIGFLAIMIMPNKYLKIPFVLITGLTLGTAGARSAVFAGAIGFFSKIHQKWNFKNLRDRLLMFLGVIVLFLLLGGLYGRATHYFNINQVKADVIDRYETTQGKSNHCDKAKDLFGNDFECIKGKLKIFGYGLSAYPYIPRPHNIMLLVYELGILTFIPIIILFFAIRPFSLFHVAITSYLLLDDSLLTAEGYYILAVIFIIYYSRLYRF